MAARNEVFGFATADKQARVGCAALAGEVGDRLVACGLCQEGQLGQLGINRAGRHAIAKLISEHRTTNIRELDAVERQQLTDLLAEVEIGINGTDAVGF